MKYSLIAFITWGIADLFYKIGNVEKKKYNDIKTGIIVGIIMGIYATVYLVINQLQINLIEILKYLPVSLCYISSMIIGYKGLKYIELSLSSPIQNTSGIITSILLIIFFKEVLPLPAYIAFILIFVSIIYIYLIEKKEERTFEVNTKKKKLSLLAIVLPILYCILDGLGTFLDALYLDKFEIISENSALIAYEYTFLIFAIIGLIYLKTKKEKLIIHKEKNKILAASFETIGQFFYIYAMADNSTISATIVGSYCVLSVLLSRIFLKEKLSLKKYIAVFATIIGVIMLAFMDI